MFNSQLGYFIRQLEILAILDQRSAVFVDPVSCQFLLHIRLIINNMLICENVENTWAAMG